MPTHNPQILEISSLTPIFLAFHSRSPPRMIAYKYPSIHANTERKRYRVRHAETKRDKEKILRETWRVGVSKKIKKLIKLENK